MKYKLFTHLKLFTLLACWLFAVPAWAQQAISGRVMGSDGGAVPGATVLERGTTNGVSTNADGAFSLTVQPNATLLISSVGYATQTIAVGTQSTINVTLAAAATELSEAVVVGYGTQTKQDLTGSVTQLTAKDVENVPTVSFEQAIQGRTPGVQINQGSGKLGAGVQIRVRGSSSVSASNQPLYVIDGIPATSTDVGSDTEPLNPIADLNPNDIESITILKDASSAAIYGSRASNGVILVNTKKGRQGQTKVNLGYYVGTSETTRRRKFLNAAQYKQLFTEAAENEGYDAAEEFEGNGLDINSKYDTDWASQAFQKGRVEQYDFNVSGGDAKTRFFLSLDVQRPDRYHHRQPLPSRQCSHQPRPLHHRQIQSRPEPVADPLGERPYAKRQRVYQPSAAQRAAAHSAHPRPRHRRAQQQHAVLQQPARAGKRHQPCRHVPLVQHGVLHLPAHQEPDAA
ncbi:TonB-dependent receptor plug domain-containing protein [Hymenobacter humi]|uniref:TonB-dependent receptor plug domain-containing protein n=1 Tax=Hymenobacter humi TaxID=1411620 RepID=A0ABW2U790_9BACT